MFHHRNIKVMQTASNSAEISHLFLLRWLHYFPNSLVQSMTNSVPNNCTFHRRIEVTDASHQPITMPWAYRKYHWHSGIKYMKMPFYPNMKTADYVFLPSYINTISCLTCFSSHFPGRFLNDTRVSWNSCWEGSFSLCHGLSCRIYIAQFSSLSLSQHELPIFSKASFIWMSANSVRSTCSEFWSCNLGETSLGLLLLEDLLLGCLHWAL